MYDTVSFLTDKHSTIVSRWLYGELQKESGIDQQ